jgi:hypothetical protein
MLAYIACIANSPAVYNCAIGIYVSCINLLYIHSFFSVLCGR